MLSSKRLWAIAAVALAGSVLTAVAVAGVGLLFGPDAGAIPGTAETFQPLTPARLLDTRSGTSDRFELRCFVISVDALPLAGGGRLEVAVRLLRLGVLSSAPILETVKN